MEAGSGGVGGSGEIILCGSRKWMKNGSAQEGKLKAREDKKDKEVTAAKEIE